MVFDEEITLGDGTGRIAVEDAEGQPLSLDKSLRLVQTFDTRSAEHVAPLLDAIDHVLTGAPDGRRPAVPRLRHPARRGPRRPAASATTPTPTSATSATTSTRPT